MMSKTIKQWKEILSNLANGLVDYGADYKYVKNDILEYYDDDETNENLLCPLAIKLFIPGSEYHLGEEYGETLYLNKTGNALVSEYDFEFTEVDEPGWIFIGYADKLRQQVSKMKDKIESLEHQAEENKNWTGLIDTLGNRIYFGNIVHWTDGGDELSLEERIKTRWDRIAVVEKTVLKWSLRYLIALMNGPKIINKNSDMAILFTQIHRNILQLLPEIVKITNKELEMPEPVWVLF